MVRTLPDIYSHGLGAKTALWDWLWTLTEHIYATEHDINNRKETCQSRGTPLHASEFGELWSRNGWERLASFCQPPKFSHWETASLTAWTLYNRQQANFGTCYVVARAYSLEQQNAGRAHAGLCHASSYIYFTDYSELCQLALVWSWWRRLKCVIKWNKPVKREILFSQLKSFLHGHKQSNNSWSSLRNVSVI